MDLGSNTFHLLIFVWENARIIPLYSSSLPAKIGVNGFGEHGIQTEAMDRGLTVLKEFKLKLDEWYVKEYRIIGTSALRQASNQAEFLNRVRDALNLNIEVISGEEEARFIYAGVQAAVPMTEPSLVVDIGGGSVEFILTDGQQVVWQSSLEVGGLRLMEKFHRFDPLPQASRVRLHDFFREALLPVTNAVHQYAPKVMVGSSGSFDTLVDMWWMKQVGHLPPEEEIAFSLSLEAFATLRDEILPLPESERLKLPGMIPLRSGMISVAIVLIEHVLTTYRLERIAVSRYSLKEGVCRTFQS